MQIVSLKIKYVVMHFNQSRNRLQNSKNIVIGHFNVNSLRNKFDAVEELVQNEIDIYFLSEKKKKIDEAFPNQQFMIIITMIISYSAETEIVMVKAFYVTLMKISPPKL